MMRPVLLTAALTGVFCSGFAFVIDWATDMLATGHVISISFLSGFLGSIFAQTVIGRGRENNE